MANLFSQLKQWSNKLTGSAPNSLSKPNGRQNSRSNRSRKAQSIRTSGQLPIGESVKKEPVAVGLPATVGAATRARKKQVRRKPPYKYIRFWLLLFLGAGIAGPGARLYLLWSNLRESVPDVTKALTYERSGTITLEASDGKVLQKVGPTAQESLSFDEIPNIVTEAFIAAEDRRFYEHDGVDYRSIARAAVANV
ncbi:MAG: transglycosylase domain-containing protein, partial [Cyanobacteria bacterium P01_D01_bin.36]